MQLSFAHASIFDGLAERNLSDLAGTESADLVISGATLAGVAAALAAAERGMKVWLLEEHTFPMPEFFAGLDLNVPAVRRREMEQALGLRPGAFRPENPRGFHPCRAKQAVEDRLLETGVRLVYLLRPLAWRSVEEHGGLELAVSGKSGCWCLRCAAFVDATPQGLFLSAFMPGTPRSRAPVYRRLEWIGVNEDRLPRGEEPLVTPDGRAYPCCPGPYSANHLLVSVPLSDPWDGRPEHFFAAEAAARADLRAAREGLTVHHSAFAKAKVAGVATMDVGPPPLDFRGEGGDSELLPGVWRVEDMESGFRVGAQIEPNEVFPKKQSGSLPVRKLACDVLVVGGGTAGASAAIAAGEQGASVLLADMSGGLGGTGTLGGIDRYWFGRHQGQSARLSRELSRREGYDARVPVNEEDIRAWNAAAKSELLCGMAEAVRVKLMPLTQFVAPVLEMDTRMTGAWLASPAELLLVDAKVTVDATGDGDVADAAGVPYVYGAPDTGATMWYALVPIHKPGHSSSQFTSWVDVRCPLDLTRAILAGHRRENKPGASEPWDHCAYLCTRESRHIQGEIQLTLTDQLRHRTFPDTVAVAFSNHDVKGYTESDWLRFGLIPPNLNVEIPYRCMVPVKVDGLLVTSKAVSGTADALPAIRMQADFENLGYACGLSAALCAEKGIQPRDLDAAAVQAEARARRVLPPAQSPEKSVQGDLEVLIMSLVAQKGVSHYQDMPMAAAQTDSIPFVELCCAGEEVIPLLLEALARADAPGRLLVAMVLAWHKRRESTPVLLEELNASLQNDAGLPPRERQARYAHSPPDQGNFPECVCLLHALAHSGDPAAVPMIAAFANRVRATDEGFTSTTAGLFDYVDVLCRLSEVHASLERVPSLKRLLEQPLWRNKTSRAPYQADWFEERKAFLEVRIARALHRCGDGEGTEILEAYTRDTRRTLALFAANALG
ncbi:MAG: FAD-dependent oxidoreductase [Verrucomicrobia bacterium]|nr:FAD-dependent oxidoreductase [Verrucomicrobiota bacterium]MCH8527567.1 FAD-dependent oxidoreductase [Kiritimatiellia bacterium]